MINANQHKTILKDFFKPYAKVILICIIVESFIRMFSMYGAKIIGNGVNALYIEDISSLKSIFISLLAILLINLVVIPLLTLLQNSLMLHSALEHNNKVYHRFFKKELQYVKIYEEGELVSRLNDDIRFFRFSLTDLIVNVGTLIITLISLVLLIFDIPIYAIFCIFISCLPIIVVNLTKNLKKKHLEEEKAYDDERSALENNLYDKFTFIVQNKLLNIFIGKIDNLFNNYYKYTFQKSIKVNRLEEALNGLSPIISQISVVLFEFYLLGKQSIKPGDITTYLLYQKSIQDIMKLVATI